ncbi:hypothetical protein ACJIZ3_019788 [Penstemon smallii]|uniref:Uncharacterized protein n=1 Tax=Penstemon smallii TaxID=265156 RepID=A0ABD3T2X0_9LAMI
MSLNSSSSSSSIELDSDDSPIVSSSSNFIDITSDDEIDSIRATMSHRAKRMIEMARRSGSNQAPRPTPGQNPSALSNNPTRTQIASSSQTSNTVRSITDASTQNTVRASQDTVSQRSTRSREHDSSTPKSVRGRKRPREENDVVVRCPGKEPVLEVSSDEDIKNIMNFELPRARGVPLDSSVLELEDERKAWKLFQSMIFKKDKIKLSKKKIKQNLKKGSRDLVSARNIMYQCYMLAERDFKDLDKMKKKLKEQHNLMKDLSANSKDAKKKQKDKLTARNADIEGLQKKVEDQNLEIEHLKLESNESYESGRAAGISMSTVPSHEQKLASAREFYRSPTYDALSDMNVGVELLGVFEKCWKQCRKLGFLNERFDEGSRPRKK